MSCTICYKLHYTLRVLIFSKKKDYKCRYIINVIKQLFIIIQIICEHAPVIYYCIILNAIYCYQNDLSLFDFEHVFVC